MAIYTLVFMCVCEQGWVVPFKFPHHEPQQHTQYINHKMQVQPILKAQNHLRGFFLSSTCRAVKKGGGVEHILYLNAQYSG